MSMNYQKTYSAKTDLKPAPDFHLLCPQMKETGGLEAKIGQNERD